MTRFQRRNGYKAKNLLNTNQEDSVLLLNVRPLPEEHGANPPPQNTTPKRDGARAIGQRVRAAICRIWPFRCSKITEDDIDRQNDEHLNIRQPYVWVPYISKADLVKTMEDKQTQTTPSTNKDQETVQASTMEENDLDVTPSNSEDQKTVQVTTIEDKNIQVTPSIDEDQKTVQAVTMEDKNIQVTPSTNEDQKTVQAMTMEDKNIQVTPSDSEDQKTVKAVTMEDKNIQVTPSDSEDQKTVQVTTMVDKNIQVTPSINEDQKSIQAATMEDKNIQVPPSTDEDQNTEQAVTEDKKTEVSPSTSKETKSAKCRSIKLSESLSLSSLHSDLSSNTSSCFTLSSGIESLQSSSISSTSHEIASPVPSGSAIKDQSCALSLEKMTCYRILGEGSYGKVVLASHPAIDQKLAVKIVQKERILKASDCKMIFRERDVLKAARESPFITHLFGSFQTRNNLIFAMECLSRGDFFDTLVEGAPFREDTIRYFIAEMLCGLQFLHSKEIVHRDIKPENILLDDAGHIKIADFGLSVTGVTESKRIEGRAGTLLYMAPEILQKLPYFGMADYYSLGLIVYVMAVGGHPFLSGDETSEEVLKIVTTVEPNYPEDMDTNLHDIIERFLCKDQEKRMRLVSEIREHPFLQMVDWKETEKGKSPPPFPSEDLSEEDLSEGMPGDELIQCEDNGMLIEPKNQKKFYGFTFVSERLKLYPVV